MTDDCIAQVRLYHAVSEAGGWVQWREPAGSNVVKVLNF
jgi:hypothetical protein